MARIRLAVSFLLLVVVVVVVELDRGCMWF
jgi:hypothetical protein